MSFSLPNGSLVHIESGRGSALPVTVATNAAPCVMTSTAHGLNNGDIVIVSSGWGRISNRVYRVANKTTDTIELEGSDTTDTDIFSAGSGLGNLYKVTGWTELQQVLNPQSQGGEQQFGTVQFLADRDETRFPTNRSAAGLNMEIADDPTSAGQVLANVADEDGQPRAVRLSNINGSKTFYYGYITIGQTPTMDSNNVQRVPVTVSYLNPKPTRYAS
jgi:hypothetical protein